jgi:hypothetical protein
MPALSLFLSGKISNIEFPKRRWAVKRREAMTAEQEEENDNVKAHTHTHTQKGMGKYAMISDE